MSTKERLADKLLELGFTDLAKRARAGEFSDFESPHACPKVELYNTLRTIYTDAKEGIVRCANAFVLAQEVANGKWDDTKTEAKAWYQKEGKDLLG